jgi:bifunctional enzyme CysN/CysC
MAVSGGIHAGEDIVVLPSGLTTRVKAIDTFDGPRASAEAGQAVVLTTADELDISRGDMFVRPRNLPDVVRRVDAYLCWMNADELVPGRSYVLGHTTRRVQAVVNAIEYRVDVDTMHREPAASLAMNDIGRVDITTADPIFVDSYRLNSATGSFILIDPHTNVTVAAGMIRGRARDVAGVTEDLARGAATTTSAGVVWEGWNIAREAREARQGHQAAVIWLTGLPGAGKTTIAKGVERRLFESGHHTMLLDGDQLRHGLCGDLGFTPTDRAENIRRAGEVARLFFEQGAIVLCAFVSPYRKDRDRVRALVPDGRFVEVLVTADAETRRARDPKGHYAKASKGQVAQFTGVSAPYEAPLQAELTIDTAALSVEAAVEQVLAALRTRGLIR